MDKIRCSIKGRPDVLYITEEEIMQEGYNVELALGDWNSCWSEVRPFHRKYVKEGFVLFFTKDKCSVTPEKSFNT